MLRVWRPGGRRYTLYLLTTSTPIGAIPQYMIPDKMPGNNAEILRAENHLRHVTDKRPAPTENDVFPLLLQAQTKPTHLSAAFCIP